MWMALLRLRDVVMRPARRSTAACLLAPASEMPRRSASSPVLQLSVSAWSAAALVCPTRAPSAESSGSTSPNQVSRRRSVLVGNDRTGPPLSRSLSMKTQDCPRGRRRG